MSIFVMNRPPCGLLVLQLEVNTYRAFATMNYYCLKLIFYKPDSQNTNKGVIIFMLLSDLIFPDLEDES